MEPDLRETLTDPGRSRDCELFTGFVLRALSEGTPLPDLGPLLLEIVRDQTRWPSVTTSALSAFIHNCPDGQDKADELRSLLADIRAERVSDTDNELLGILLYELYPRHLSPSEVWDFLIETSIQGVLVRHVLRVLHARPSSEVLGGPSSRAPRVSE